jgi:uncharacterized protein YggU (UPF0235/DUF167 family)
LLPAGDLLPLAKAGHAGTVLQSPAIMLHLETHPDGTLLGVRARAGGRTNGITGTHQGALRVSVTQVPEKGKANQAIVAVLATAFGCGKHQVRLVRGGSSLDKQFLIVGIPAAEVERVVKKELGP